MNQTFGKIGIRSKNAKLLIRQQQADMEIRQPKAEMTIRKIPGKLMIDQTEAFAQEHLKSVGRLIKDYAEQGHKAALQGIARRAEQGDRLMRIEDGGNAIAELARINSTDPPLHFNIGFMPRSVFSVKIHYQPGKLLINWQTHHPQVEVHTHSPEFHYIPGDVKVYMRQWPSLDIQVVGSNYDENI